MTDTPVIPPTITADVEKRVAQFVEIRDALKVMDDAHGKARKELADTLVLLLGWFQTVLDATSASSIKTDAGTIHNTTKYTASVKDATAFMKFVQDNNLWDLLDKKANANACRDYIAEKGIGIVPGVNLTQHKTVGVKRPRE